MTTALKIYEINTAAYLFRLSQELKRPVTLENIPDSEIDMLVELGFNTVWLMGIWQRSSVAVEINKSDPGFMSMVTDILPDVQDEDIIGSAYSLKAYEVDPAFGGKPALQAYRQRLHKRGLKLILDFVPNHVGPDHAWTTNEELFIAADEAEAKELPTHYFTHGNGAYAKGRDPTFEPWSDVLQLNAFSDAYRQSSVAALQKIATLSDGVRCDMAMLLLNRVFESTWGHKVGEAPETEYWQIVIDAVKASNPDFIFIAETYWNTERELIGLGFDYCYDKELLDHLAQGSHKNLHNHLHTTAEYRSKLISFIENHDEQRAASVFDEDKILAAAATILTLPGSYMIYDGQLEGHTLRLPVQLRRGPEAIRNEKLREKYHSILKILKTWKLDELDWQILQATNNSVHAWMWHDENTNRIVAINYSAKSHTVRLDLPDGKVPIGSMVDELGQSKWPIGHSERGGSLKLAMQPWQVMLLS